VCVYVCMCVCVCVCCCPSQAQVCVCVYVCLCVCVLLSLTGTGELCLLLLLLLLRLLYALRLCRMSYVGAVAYPCMLYAVCCIALTCASTPLPYTVIGGAGALQRDVGSLVTGRCHVSRM
jgi:hypothetical protein